MPGADAQTRPRPVIVKFATAHVLDVVIRARRRLRESGDRPTVYVNEDVTRRRAALVKKSRQLKKSKKINDCWTFNGKVIVKTVDVIEWATLIDNLQHESGDINHSLFIFVSTKVC